jgi:hypothetical protein
MPHKAAVDWKTVCGGLPNIKAAWSAARICHSRLSRITDLFPSALCDREKGQGTRESALP